ADARMWEERLSPRGRELAEAEPTGREADETEAAPTAPGPLGGVGWRGEQRDREPADRQRPPLALMLDWENIKISLADLLQEMPEARAHALRPRLAGAELAARLRDAAWRHGSPRQRWAVADWDRPSFEGDQKAVKSAGYFSDIAGEQKFNSSDHVLR